VTSHPGPGVAPRVKRRCRFLPICALVFAAVATRGMAENKATEFQGIVTATVTREGM